MVLLLLLLTGAGVLKLMREAGAGVDSFDSLTEARVGTGGVSFAESLDSFADSLDSLPVTRMDTAGLSLGVLVAASSLFMGVWEPANVRAVGMHATRDSLKIGIRVTGTCEPKHFAGT